MVVKAKIVSKKPDSKKAKSVMVSKSEVHFHKLYENSYVDLVDCKNISFLGIKIVMGGQL